MTQSLCTPSNIYGGQKQHLLLGATVTNFSVSIGWNQQESEMSFELVTDPCTSEAGKVYFDGNLVRQITHDADPGFYPAIFPEINFVGCPVYFRFGDGTDDIEYTGIIQSWEQLNSQGGYPVYSLKLTGPNAILDGCKCILQDYAGAVTTYNTFNLYGFMEYSAGFDCPLNEIDGAFFGSPAGRFGGALVNDNGMPYNKIGPALAILTSSIPRIAKGLNIAGNWSPYGRILFRGVDPNFANYGLIRADTFMPEIIANFQNHNGFLSEYLLDLSDIPVPPDTWRTGGLSQSILEIITNVCSDLGCDFYLELSPSYFGGEILKVVKVRTVRRLLQPNLHAIRNFVNQNAYVVDKKQGQELRNEVTTALLLGGNVQSIFSIDQNPEGVNPGDFEGTCIGDPVHPDTLENNPQESDIILPFFGQNIDGSVIVPQRDSECNWFFEIDPAILNALLYNALPVEATLGKTKLTITEKELRCVNRENQMGWWGFALNDNPFLGGPTDIGKCLKAIYGNDVKSLLDPIGSSISMRFAQDTLHIGGDLGFLIDKVIIKDLQTIFNWLNEFATRLGRSWMVALPYTCVYRDPESLLDRYTEEPAQGGWSEETEILGLPNPTFTSFFANPDGLIGGFMVFPALGVDIDSNIDPHNVLLYGENFYVKATVGDKIIFEDYPNRRGPRVAMETIDLRKILDFDENASMLQHATISDDDAKRLRDAVGGILLNGGLQKFVASPISVAVPMRSNMLRYGPWVQQGPAGQVKIELDEGLVPWQFGNLHNLDIAATQKSKANLTQLQVGETGSITVPGFPTVPLGAELGAKGVGYLNSYLLIENRIVNTNRFITPNSQNAIFITLQSLPWTGLYGPNITGISISAGQSGFRTTYTLRTFTPKIGLIARKNYERLKILGQQIIKINKFLNAKGFIEAKGQLGLERTQFLEDKFKDLNPGNNPLGHHSPVGLLVGQVIKDDDTDTNYTSVFNYDFKEATSELLAQYDQKAFMSMDGLIRPVSIKGDGGLPGFANTFETNETGANYTIAPEPPVEGYDPITVSSYFLNPFIGPDDASHGSQFGHDITWVGRGSDVPKHLNLNRDVELGGDGYLSDSRIFALRGPLIIQGWGYDIQGKPIPNQGDSLSLNELGFFADTGLTDAFPDDWLGKPYSWPVGPLDIRFDQKRGVWTVPPSFRIVHAIFDGDLVPFGTVDAHVQLDDGAELDDETGENIIARDIVLNDLVGNSGSEGDHCLAYYDTFHEEYRIIHSLGTGGGSSNLFLDKFDCYNDVINSGGTPTTRIEIGQGLQLQYRLDNPAISRIDAFFAAEKRNTNDVLLDGHALADTQNTLFNTVSIGPGLGARKADDEINNTSGCKGLILFSNLRVGNTTTDCYTHISSTDYSEHGVEDLVLADGFNTLFDDTNHKVTVFSQVNFQPSTLWANGSLATTGFNNVLIGKGLSAQDVTEPSIITDNTYGCDAVLISIKRRVFKLEACDDSSIVYYTEQNLENYLLEAVKFDCLNDDHCYLVTELTPSQIISINPTVENDLNITQQFCDCKSCIGQCFRIELCGDPTIFFITHDSSLKQYLNKVIKVNGSCWIVFSADCTDDATNVTFTVQDVFDKCTQCKSCYNLCPCNSNNPADCFVVSDDLSSYDGKIIALNDNTCYNVNKTSNCGTATTLGTGIRGTIPGCQYCNSCWLLTPYDGSCVPTTPVIVTNTDMSSYGPVVKIGSVCYAVSKSPTCEGAVAVTVDLYYPDCTTCNTGHCYTVTACYGSMTFKVKNYMPPYVGKTFFITGYDGCFTTDGTPAANCSGAITIAISQVNEDFVFCDNVSCNTCYVLNECSPGSSTIYTNQDLAKYADGTQSVKVGDKCYTVSKTSCEGQTIVPVSILSNASTCEACQTCWKLTPYDESCEPTTPTICTTTNLEQYNGKVLLVGSTCYTVSGQTTCSGCSDITYNQYDSCQACSNNACYLLTPIDPTDCSSGCCSSPGDGSGDGPQPFCTKSDLSSVVDQLIKIDGVCYVVVPEDCADCSSPEDVSFDGPYSDCKSCIEAPQIKTLTFITSVTLDGGGLCFKKTSVCVPVSTICDGGRSCILTDPCT